MVHNLRTIGFQELLAFVLVVKKGGITAAAEELGLAKSAVSGQITKLEQRLNIQLLNRHSRRVSLTKEGANLLPRIESLLAEGEQLFQEAELEENLPKGIVKIAATPEFAQRLLVHFVPMVREQLPDIQLVIKTAYNFEDLQDPSFDLAFRLNKVKDDRLVAKEIGQYYRYFYAHPDLANIDTLRHPSQLADLPCVVFSDTTTQRVWHAENMETDETVDVSINAITCARNFNILADLASVGHGICFVPSYVADHHIKTKHLRPVLTQWRSKVGRIYLAYRFGADRIARVKAVLDLAKAEMPALLNEKL